MTTWPKSRKLFLGIVTFVALSLYSCMPNAYGFTFGDQRNLTNDLFANYKKNLRPFPDDSQPTEIYMGVWLVSIVDLQEKSQMLKFSAYLYMEWKDPSLTWNSSAYNGVTQFTYPQQEMWIPDVTILNSVETMNQLGFDRNVLGVNNTGNVTWTPSGVFSTACNIDITFYPFDTQTCQVIFSTVFSRSTEVQLETDPQNSELREYYTPSGIWSIVDLSMNPSEDQFEKPRIVFNIRLKRLRPFYVISLIVPVLFLAATSTLVFALPPDTGEKMGTSITVLLAYAVYLSIISDQMPKSSLYVSVLSVYVTFLLGITCLGVILSVWVLNLHSRDNDAAPPSARMRTIIAFLRQSMLCDRKRATVHVAPTSTEVDDHGLPGATVWSRLDATRHYSNSRPDATRLSSIAKNNEPRLKGENPSLLSDQDNLKEVTWEIVSATLDSFFLRCFSLLLVFSTVACLTILIVGGGD